MKEIINMGETKDQTPQNPPVYLSFKTFQSSVASLREHGLPSKLDRSVWSTRSGLDQTQILSAFRFLDFVDGQSNTQQRLRDLVATKENSDEEKKILAAILKERYAKVFALDLKSATPLQFNEAIGSYGATGTTRDRSVRFFIKAAKHCGIELSKRLTKAVASRSNSSSTKTANRRARSKSSNRQSNNEGTSQESTAMKTVTLPLAGGELTISGNFNWFQLVGDERTLVLGIIDKMVEFENKQEQQ
jgi:hypothetical protein